MTDIFRVPSIETSYFLGYIAGNNIITDKKISIYFKQENINCARSLQNFLREKCEVRFMETHITIHIHCAEMVEIIKNLLANGKFDTDWHYLRGYVDATGTVNDVDIARFPECYVRIFSNQMLDFFRDFKEFPYEHDRSNVVSNVVFRGINAIDFLGKIYENCGIYRGDFNYDRYKKWVKNSWRPNNSLNDLTLGVYKTDENAVIPFKSQNSDAGLDVTIIRKHKIFNESTTLYDTGIKLVIPIGYYIEIVARSSLSKTGYMLANNVAIIDNSYRGNIYIPLTRVSQDAGEIELPFRCCQMILKKQEYIEVEEIFQEPGQTGRNAGGFGSTSIK
jgi:dUTP pyrophosphatase